MIRTATAALGSLALAVASASPAAALTIDFEGFAHGTVIDDQYQSMGVEIRARNFASGHPDLAVAFDSNRSNTRDMDLESPWSVGNLAPGTDLGNILILQENGNGCGDGVCDDPDDEGRRPAGRFSIFFEEPVVKFGFDVIDVDDETMEDGRIVFYEDGQNLGYVAFSELVDPGSAHYDPSITYGDNSANRIDAFSAGEFGAGGFDKVVIKMGGSGGVDNFRFKAGSPVPEPGAVALFGLGLPLVAAARRRAVR